MSGGGVDEIPVTQIIHLALQRESKPALSDSGVWAEALDLVEPGAQRVYWGRSLEHPQHGQLHIVRRNLAQHHQFLKSDSYQQFLAIHERITGQPQKPVVRHAQIKSWTPNDPSLARGAPFVGTAIYLNTIDGWDDGAWPLWTHIVRHVGGCLGCAGGPVLEPVETCPGPLQKLLEGEKATQTFNRSYIVYVGWESPEKHDAFHHTEHFAKHFVILNCVNDGYAEYGHIVFEGSREKGIDIAAKM
ncbi:hypothetical protein CLAFUW4_07173 [Fulvia fulva]|uniref:Uncharacterized protein n=1 Tax=Passalora fulva TaxID=5499 RepID=A0A9Q8PBJ7_PASFU|nr:uncharacterized protein CLAFUR5_07307 [Fulvia fulva]KAK4621680.1 hypothetical protein CLAFUR4_07182 [Fulvia fulva]KAK4622450.1 hypothetical protein CLAFUR0_07180 [Fulvia fulva]UJO19458.1 hypothetical protein CLAFUR5_07307 [Fulvia fulva]WPV15857.1 hypothetical protein CLAFUW4_07173 [Fulvia fulva]WPV31295.1 hypothetical protein CLAFUW7_07174 [Fulvia fulva]